MNIVARLCGGALGSVAVITIMNSAWLAFDANHLSPVITQSSPSRTATQRKLVGSDPPCGSVIAKVEKMSPSSSGWRYCAFCSSVPNMARISLLPVSGPWQPNTTGPNAEVPNISFI